MDQQSKVLNSLLLLYVKEIKEIIYNILCIQYNILYIISLKDVKLKDNFPEMQYHFLWHIAINIFLQLSFFIQYLRRADSVKIIKLLKVCNVT